MCNAAIRNISWWGKNILRRRKREFGGQNVLNKQFRKLQGGLMWWAMICNVSKKCGNLILFTVDTR